MGVMTANGLGYGRYIDSTTNNQMKIFVENATCLSKIITNIHNFFMDLFSIQKTTLRFTTSKYVFTVEKEALVTFIQDELKSVGAQNMVSKDTIKSFLPTNPLSTQDFEVFLTAAKASVLAVKSTQVVSVLSASVSVAKSALTGVGKFLNLV